MIDPSGRLTKIIGGSESSGCVRILYVLRLIVSSAHAAIMAKGSQLSQLKSALAQAGVSKQNQSNGKKRKRSVLDEKEKERKAAKLRDIQQKMNPFDVKVTKLKHDVGGRKIAGTMGKPAQSKQAGIERVRH